MSYFIAFSEKENSMLIKKITHFVLILGVTTF